MWKTEKTSQIATEMRRYNLAALRISENHWTQAGQQRLDTGEMLLYSGHEEENDPHTQGVALMLSNVARNTLVGWEPHGSRIIKASFKTKKEEITMNIIQCYAPINDRNDDIKDQLYEQLQSIIAKCPRNDLTILMKELNSKENRKGIKEVLTSTCQEVLGFNKHHHKKWISIETLDKIKGRKNKKTAIKNSRKRAEKVQAQAEYRESNKQVKKSIRVNKEKYVEELATMAEKAAREGNVKPLYNTTKKLVGKYSKPERPTKDKEGRPTTEIQQQRNRWAEYFEELPNRPAPMNPPDMEATHTDLPRDFNPPTTEEIRMAIRQIKSGKAAGPDNITAEALKILNIHWPDTISFQLKKKLGKDDGNG
ncbi:unnamed protein product [Schistosoma margrebowiei]|uniref:Uncharacterized protein n=1 Tax=Schistosoma margrebowiei TaxID=48269 RepID=A0A183LL73_9TREM|nr:unnamed protein product [Schistosoma margrebowiei]